MRRGELVREVAAQGTLASEHVQWLSAESPGRVARIAVRAGAHVEPDTVVVVLNNADLELAELVQLDVKTRDEQETQQSALVSLRADLRGARSTMPTAAAALHVGALTASVHPNLLSPCTASPRRGSRSRSQVLRGATRRDGRQRRRK